MSKSKDTASGGIGLMGLVFIVFLVLKLAEIGQVATWSWWWVTAPLWGPLLLGIAILLIYLAFLGLTLKRKTSQRERMFQSKSSFQKRLEKIERKGNEN